MTNLDSPGPLEGPYHGHILSKAEAERAAAREARVKASQEPSGVLKTISALIKRLTGGRN